LQQKFQEKKEFSTLLADSIMPSRHKKKHNISSPVKGSTLGYLTGYSQEQFSMGICTKLPLGIIFRNLYQFGGSVERNRYFHKSEIKLIVVDMESEEV
jgi:hypothetical protein